MTPEKLSGLEPAAAAPENNWKEQVAYLRAAGIPEDGILRLRDEQLTDDEVMYVVYRKGIQDRLVGTGSYANVETPESAETDIQHMEQFVSAIPKERRTFLENAAFGHWAQRDTSTSGGIYVPTEFKPVRTDKEGDRWVERADMQNGGDDFESVTRSYREQLLVGSHNPETVQALFHSFMTELSAHDSFESSSGDPVDSTDVMSSLRKAINSDGDMDFELALQYIPQCGTMQLRDTCRAIGEACRRFKIQA